MSDISKCPGEGCPVRETCLRFTVRPDEVMQSWIETPGVMVRDNGANRWDCPEYITNRPYRRVHELG